MKIRFMMIDNINFRLQNGGGRMGNETEAFCFCLPITVTGWLCLPSLPAGSSWSQALAIAQLRTTFCRFCFSFHQGLSLSGIPIKGELCEGKFY